MGCAASSVVDMYEVESDKDASSRRKGNAGARREPFTRGAISEYSFIGKLGQGAVATVHGARASKLGDRTVAVKIMDLRGTEEWDPKQLSAQRHHDMQREVALLARVTGSPNVIDFCGSFMEGCLGFIVMEKCECSLLQAINHMLAITEATMSRMLQEMLTGLAAVHSLSVVHRDVKPENFLCVGPQSTVKLCDFGMASVLLGPGDGLSGVCGTPPFMSPEMLCGLSYNHMSDAWSFGVIVYSMFYGRLPYEPSQRTTKAMRECIRSGVPAPSFSPPGSLISAVKVSDGAKQLSIELLKRNPDQRISAESARHHHFFAAPGNTNLAPMIEAARLFGSFTTSARNDPSRKNEVDIRIESLQWQHKEILDFEAFKARKAMAVQVSAKKDFDEDCSTHLASEDSPRRQSPVTSLDEDSPHRQSPETSLESLEG